MTFQLINIIYYNKYQVSIVEHNIVRAYLIFLLICDQAEPGRSFCNYMVPTPGPQKTGLTIFASDQSNISYTYFVGGVDAVGRRVCGSSGYPVPDTVYLGPEKPVRRSYTSLL